MTDQRLLRHQRHRARHRRRSCTARRACSSSMTGARPTARASCCSRPASFPTAAPGSTSSSIPRTILYFRVDRRRKMPVTILLKAIGLTPEQILAQLLRHRHLPASWTRASQFELVPERLRGEVATLRHPRQARQGRSSPRTSASPSSTSATWKRPGIKQIAVPDDFLLGPRAGAQHRRHRDRRDPGQGQRRDHRDHAGEAARSRGIEHSDALHQRSGPGRVHFADPAHRRDRRPVRRARRHLPHDASRRAADGRRGGDPVQRPVLHRRALRPVGAWAA